jgi:hypothetical protein
MRSILYAAFGALALTGCTSDPNAAINQTFPIRQMDQFFGSLSAPRVIVPPDYTRRICSSRFDRL